MIHDPIEDTKLYQNVSWQAEKDAEAILEDMGIVEQMPNYLKIFWAYKKRILKEEYHLDWKTPMEMNPDSIFN